MIYAIKNGIKVKATKNEEANCICCNEKVKSYCGEINVWHWRHIFKNKCDEWFEGESDWHLSWKLFPQKEFTEVLIIKDKKLHIADILTKNNIVIELQKSNISVESIKEREDFYGEKMIWLIHKQQLSIKTFNLDDLNVNIKLPFSFYFDDKLCGFPVWVIDFLNYQPNLNLFNELQKSGFEKEKCNNLFIKRSTYSRYKKNGFFKDVNRDLIFKLKEFKKELQNNNTNIKLFNFETNKRCWVFSKRPIFIDDLTGSLFWLKHIHNNYGIYINISKQFFIKKYLE